jgi:hypothetical protein
MGIQSEEKKKGNKCHVQSRKVEKDEKRDKKSALEIRNKRNIRVHHAAILSTDSD